MYLFAIFCVFRENPTVLNEVHEQNMMLDLDIVIQEGKGAERFADGQAGGGGVPIQYS